MRPRKDYELSDRRLKILIALACLIVGWLWLEGRSVKHSLPALAQNSGGNYSLGVEGVSQFAP